LFGGSEKELKDRTFYADRARNLSESARLNVSILNMYYSEDDIIENIRNYRESNSLIGRVLR